MTQAKAVRKTRRKTTGAKKKRTILVTGYPGFIG